MIMVNKIWFPEMINAIILKKKKKTGNKIELPLEGNNRESEL